MANDELNYKDVSHMYAAAMEEYPAMQLCQRAYKTRFARIKARRVTKEQFVIWGEQARVYRDRVMAGEKGPRLPGKPG